MLSDGQFERLKRELEEQYQGTRQRRPAAAARRRARLEGDVAFAQGHGFHGGEARGGARDRACLRRAADAARHSGRQHLFANYQEANRVFWRGTVLPLASRIGQALAQWLAPAFGEGLEACGRRRRSARRWPPTAPRSGSRSPRAPFLTVNEKRGRPAIRRSRAATGLGRGWCGETLRILRRHSGAGRRPEPGSRNNPEALPNGSGFRVHALSRAPRNDRGNVCCAVGGMATAAQAARPRDCARGKHGRDAVPRKTPRALLATCFRVCGPPRGDCAECGTRGAFRGVSKAERRRKASARSRRSWCHHCRCRMRPRAPLSVPPPIAWGRRR